MDAKKKEQMSAILNRFWLVVLVVICVMQAGKINSLKKELRQRPLEEVRYVLSRTSQAARTKAAKQAAKKPAKTADQAKKEPAKPAEKMAASEEKE